jgi:hypothetical protein
MDFLEDNFDSIFLSQLNGYALEIIIYKSDLVYLTSTMQEYLKSIIYDMEIAISKVNSQVYVLQNILYLKKISGISNVQLLLDSILRSLSSFLSNTKTPSSCSGTQGFLEPFEIFTMLLHTIGMKCGFKYILKLKCKIYSHYKLCTVLCNYVWIF